MGRRPEFPGPEQRFWDLAKEHKANRSAPRNWWNRNDLNRRHLELDYAINGVLDEWLGNSNAKTPYE